MKLKDEKYNGVRMKFTHENGNVFANAYGIGVLGKGRTKADALHKAKSEIRHKKRRGNIR